jgi:hypothetical protein
MQSRPLPNTLSSQPYSNYFGHNYSSQPSRQDPWTGQGPPRNPNVPRSGFAVFDPETDPVPPHVDLSAFVNDVDYWTMTSTDPNYLISPNAPVAPPQDLFMTAQQSFLSQQQQQHLRQQQRQLQHQQQSLAQPQRQPRPQVQNNSSPIEMRVTTASPTPDANNFVNYNHASSVFSSRYAADPVPTSLITSVEFPTSLTTSLSVEQAPTSPLYSPTSPSGSEGIHSSYQPSDPGMVQENHTSEALDARLLPPPSPGRPSPNRSIPEVTFDFSPSPEHLTEHPARRSGASKATGRPGGRMLGTHLPAKVAKAAHDMRKTVACWHCVLQRDKVRGQLNR